MESLSQSFDIVFIFFVSLYVEDGSLQKKKAKKKKSRK